MPNKKFCRKCDSKHVPPTGKNCRRSQDLEVQASTSTTTHVSNDSSSDMSLVSSDAENSQYQATPDSIQVKILEELQKVNRRLDSVEEDVATVKKTTHQRTGKLSNFSKSKSKHCKSSFVSESESSSDESIVPSLNVLKTSSDIQKQVDKRLRQLQEANASTSGKNDLKSKRGGNIDCVVKHKVAWPQDTILGGHNRQRVTYDQLNLTQWVQGFAQNMLDQKSQKTKDQMLQYLVDIMADATDFSWQNAKAAHAVLLCDMERGAVTWDNSDKIDRIRRAHAQRHSQTSKSWVKTSEQGNMKKPWFCKLFQNGSCTFQKDHESNGKWQRHVCATCLDRGKILNHSEKECTWAKRPKNE